MPLGEHKSEHPLHYFTAIGQEYTDRNFTHEAIRAILRCDGAIGFQRLHPSYDEGQLYFLSRKEWIVQWENEI